MNGARALVTGGLGFIGSNVAHRLVALGAQVTLVDNATPDSGANPFNLEGIRDRVTLIEADARDERRMAEAVRGQDYVFNLVGHVSHLDSMRDPFGDLRSNCEAPLAVLEACRKANPKAKIIYAATRQQYGRVGALPANELEPMRPRDINGIHKTAGEAYHLLYAEIYGMRTASLRLTNTYGPRQLMRHNRQGFVYWFIRQALDGERITVFGDGTQLRDLTYVDDVVEAFLLAAKSEQVNGDTFNLGGPQPVTLEAFTKLLVSIVGQGSYVLAPFPEERKGVDIGSFYADWGKLKKTVGWEPNVALEEGLRRTIGYYRTHRAHYW